MNRYVALCLAALFAVPAPAAPEEDAPPPKLGFPAKCTRGEDCWIVNYVDVLENKGEISDFQCGARTYDDHKGTDIAIRDLKAMEAGVDVIAAAPGKVLRVRDGETDKVRTREELTEIQKSGRECGNGVLVGHGGGWQTIYCHMRQGSIVVKPGQQVEAGTKLGLVGHSGFVEFPHVHIGLTHRGKAVDPFTGLERGKACGTAGTSLWRDGVDYEPVSIYAAGFRNGEPKFEDVRLDTSSPERLAAEPAELTFWTLIYGAAKDDAIRLEIRAPDGSVVAAQDLVQERTRARQFYFTGKRLPDLKKGVYAGTVRLTRKTADGGTLTRELERKITVE